MHVDWRGIYPAVTTQLTQDGALDLDATQTVIDRLVHDGVHGLVMLGTVGENCSLSADEKRAVVKAALEASNGRVPVLSGVAEYTTELAKTYARDCERIGLDGLMVLPAMVYKADAREAKAHIADTARACGLPVMIYNNPVAYGIDLSPKDLIDLSKVDNIRAVKESSEDPRRITDIMNLDASALSLVAGVDDVAMECMILGAIGWVSGFANVFPAESVRLYELLQAGEIDKARQIYRWMMPALHMDTHPKLVQMIKLAEQVAGRGSETVRRPRLRLEGGERDEVVKIIETALANPPAV
ncbi:MAG TPA: dihydrodipicolinate synthase family protein [Gammaproteobacteria bacterium]|nr:dihydrodipicolinate synthase family protein [Gammaproteobacteria bacterium]